MPIDIHSPSISSNTQPEKWVVPDSKDGLLELIKEKDKVEAEMRALGEVLDSHQVTMQTPLIDPEGFPRSDIDVPQIRTVRARITQLRSDWKVMMACIESGLHAQFANLDPSPSSSSLAPSSATASIASSAPQDELVGTAFAKVNSVSPNSPAAVAGLRAGDMMKIFGSVNASNHRNLSKLAEAVASNEGKQITVVVERDGMVQALQLVPRQGWGGRGMLGCHLVPL